MTDHARALLESLYAAAVEGAAPGPAVRRALDRDATLGAAPTWLVAIGKASHAMTEAAVRALEARGCVSAGGIIIGATDERSPDPSLVTARGSHPVPDAASRAAADRLAQVVARVGRGDDVIVLLSGGATSLVAAPVEGVSESALEQCFAALLASGADIVAMNAIRKRIARWGAGRLGVALGERGVTRVRCLIVSDVLGDDPESIASGPCVGDALSAADVLALIDRDGLEGFVPAPVRDWLAIVARGDAPETPKPDDPRLARVTCEVILGNADACAAAAARARELGLAPVKLVAEPLDDDAALTGERLVEELIRFREAGLADDHDGAPTERVGCMIWGGETTVRLGASVTAPGGRCQELALSAAFALAEAGERGAGIALLAAGTDGRDGPTDAAGAVVDEGSWGAIRDAGRDPERDLVEHDSHRALDSVHALLRVGPTGTNVGDVVIGIVDRASGGG